MELNFLDQYKRSFSIFHLFPENNTKKSALKRKILKKKNLIFF